MPVDATAIEAALLAKKHTSLHLQFSEPKKQLTATTKNAIQFKCRGVCQNRARRQLGSSVTSAPHRVFLPGDALLLSSSQKGPFTT